MPALLAAVDAVLALHQSKHYDEWGRDHEETQGHGGWCDSCGRFSGASCPTVTAITRALETK